VLSLVILFSPSTPSEGGLYGLDKVVHATLFAALALTTRWRFGRGLVFVLAYAAASEVLQAVLPISRDGNVPDVLADAVGALVGWYWASRRARPTTRTPLRVER